jgi:dimethylargininase
MERYERTYVGDSTIDLAAALAEHEGYRVALQRCGADVIVLETNIVHPDCVFVEDTAIVLDEVAVMMSMGAESRRGEPAGIERTLADFRPIEHVRLPATIDGGDVVRAGRTLYVGISARTNIIGVAALADVVARYDYDVVGVPVTGCLHLKTACSALPDGRFLVNRDWIDVSPLPADRLIDVPRDEPWAGDVLVIGEQIIASSAFHRTADVLDEQGWEVLPVPVSEFAKAEGGVTCMSLMIGALG